jgi:DNA-binding transcriptional MerR regulator
MKKGVLIPIKIDDQTYYRTLEVCRETSVSRATLFRWLSLGILPQILKDRRGWRLFTKADLNIIRTEASRTEIVDTLPLKKKRDAHEDTSEN